MTDVFCDILIAKREEVLGETKYFSILHEPRPVSPGHSIIITKRHAQDAFELNAEEWSDFGAALVLAKELAQVGNPDGYNIGMNCGASAGQSQFHFHAHFIPRYVGDVPNPLGGVRNILGNSIPPKQD